MGTANNSEQEGVGGKKKKISCFKTNRDYGTLGELDDAKWFFCERQFMSYTHGSVFFAQGCVTEIKQEALEYHNKGTQKGR